MFSVKSTAAYLAKAADNWGIERKNVPTLLTGALILGTLAVTPKVEDRGYATIAQLALANIGLVGALSSALAANNSNTVEEYCSQLYERVRQVASTSLAAVAAVTVGVATYKFATFERGHWLYGGA